MGSQPCWQPHGRLTVLPCSVAPRSSLLAGWFPVVHDVNLANSPPHTTTNGGEELAGRASGRHALRARTCKGRRALTWLAVQRRSSLRLCRTRASGRGRRRFAGSAEATALESLFWEPEAEADSTLAELAPASPELTAADINFSRAHIRDLILHVLSVLCGPINHTLRCNLMVLQKIGGEVLGNTFRDPGESDQS